MKRNTSGVAVVAVLVAVVVAATVYIASFGKSSRHAELNAEPAQALAIEASAPVASGASEADARTAAR
ncbi:MULTISPECIES: hypothetical protein [unclassified Caballeronia]|uniref:hypothetical protein n=1 Tax=unclassified Caballeronia TaxID=2646786 RepID=UPI001FD21637|nr:MULTISPECIES: hypothetical protein [unclassified Caballeronia]MDR5775925.1 hypothetical protein [Caballeronia sp. LZ002]MDR5851364.1 hypothetical protein [Caballeronia sp. LZ003]